MKLIVLFYPALVAVLLFSSCGKDNSSNDTASTAAEVTATSTTNSNIMLVVSINKAQITADGADEAKFTVKDNAGADVTATSVIYVNDKALAKNTFTTTTPGSYQVKAIRGSNISVVINLIATASTPVNGTGGNNPVTAVFTQRVLTEFFTGTWCGICPGTLIPLETYTNANPNTIMVAVHGPNGSSDPFQYVYDSQLRNTFNVSGVPTVLVNRKNNWDGSTATFDALSRNTAVLGIGIETSVSGSSISVKAKVKFGTTMSNPLKLVVMLVEDGIRYDQANYGHFGLPNPISGFVHRNILRSTATDLYGDAIPGAQQVADNIWQKDFTIDASKYDISKCRIVAFVTNDVNSGNPKGVLNSQIVDAGKAVNF